MSENFTVGELRAELAHLTDDMIIGFGGGLTFSYIKIVEDEKEAVILWREIQADLKPDTRNYIKVAFGHTPEPTDTLTHTYAPRL